MLITIGYMNMAFYEDSRSCVQGFQRLFDNLMENKIVFHKRIDVKAL